MYTLIDSTTRTLSKELKQEGISEEKKKALINSINALKTLISYF